MIAEQARIESALSYVPAVDRELWLRMGMAVKSELGDEGFSVWDAWSQSAENYRERDARAVWKSINDSGKVTAGTLYHEAKQRGWKPSDAASDQAEAGRMAQAKHTAAERARQILAAATGEPRTHAYWHKKIVSLGPLVRRGAWPQRGWTDALLVPIYQRDGNVWGVEAIKENGDKDTLRDCRKGGGFYPFGKIRGASRLLIGEGVATVAAALTAETLPAAAALTASNLKAVAMWAREVAAPGADIIILADFDPKPDGSNPGMKAAQDAARAVGGRIAVPELDGRACDFWNVWAERGQDAIQHALANAQAPVNSEGSGGEWPEPKAIRAALHPVPAFDAGTLLPEALRAWIIDEADRMPCPPDFIAAGALVALGAIIGARCTIKPKSRDDWLIVPNLWGGVVSLPSAKKSPAIGAALKPLDRLIALAMEAHRAEVETFEANITVFEAKREAIEFRIKSAAKAKDGKPDDLNKIATELQTHRKDAPQPPILRRYKSNDTTPEKLGELLRDNPAGLLVLRDELVGLIASWEKEGREGERAFYLEGWNGCHSFDTDRIKRGSIFIPNHCVSVFGGIQPDKLTGYLEQAANALANDGMLQRFQVLVYPDYQAWEWRDRIPDKAAREQAFAVFETLANFDPVAWGAAPADDFAKFPHFRFDAAAQEIFIEWSGDLHRTRLPAEDQPIIAQHLAKFDKLFPALALIIHLCDCAATRHRGPVTEQAALRAAAWCDYLEAHARRCYGLLADDGLRAAQALADKVRQGKLSDGFTARDVRRNQWRYLTTGEAVQAALDWLEDEAWLQADEVGGAGPGTGRSTVRYSINPKAVRPDKSGGEHGELA